MINSYRPGSYQTLQLPNAQISTISYHDHDHSRIEKLAHPQGIAADIGTSFWDNSAFDELGSVDSLSSLMIGRTAVLKPGFVACAVTEKDQSVYIISDRFGLKPLYYAYGHDYFIFSTKLLTLLKSKLFSWHVHMPAVVDLLSFEHVTSHHTLVDKVMLLPPASLLVYHQGQLSIKQYGDPLLPGMVTSSHREKCTPEIFYQTLGNSVARAVEPYDRISITLSGGLDSRALLHYAAKQDKPVSAFSFGQPQSRDLELAAQLAQRVQVEHTKLSINDAFFHDWLNYAIFMTDGMVGATHFHILSLANMLKSNGGVVLDGLGGDAMTGSHLKWGMLAARQVDSAAAVLYHQRVTAFSNLQQIQAVLHADCVIEKDYDAWTPIRNSFSQVSSNKLWKGCHVFDFMQRQRRFIQFGSHLIQPMVPVETPFYDQDFLDCVLAMSPRQLCEQSLYLKVHAKFMHDLAVVPDSLRGIPLTWPQSVRFGKKVLDFTRRKVNARLNPGLAGSKPSTTNYRIWFQQGLRPLLSERLLETEGMWRDIINRQAVESLLDEHMNNSEDHTNRLGCLLALATWCEQVNQL
jgi:asparagine synthase (glutamine-hydrolysing)